jgi:pyruvate,water dikinase
MSKPDFFVSPSEINQDAFSLVGGKGVNLNELMRNGINVPDWYVITTDLFNYTTKINNVCREINRFIKKLNVNDSINKIDKITLKIKEKVDKINFSQDISNDMIQLHKRIISDDCYFSVRSSAVDEDGLGASFAGLHDSFLFVKGYEDLFSKIKKVWASAYNTRAIVFRLKNGLPLEDISIAVIVQKMVEADVSGILFTANPNNGNVHQVLISSLFGAGEGIVSAGLDADLYTVSKTDGHVEKNIADKTERLVFDTAANNGLVKTSVNTRDAVQSSLSDSQIKTLSDLGMRIEKQFEKPQDIEFSIDERGDIFILQARPITAIDEYGPAAGHRLIWDNSNIIESYSGPTTPMTFSFIKRAYTIVYHCFSEVMGISEKKVAGNRHVFENMLGLFNGQVYYNLINWYRLIHLFPGFNYNKSFMESMMGLKEKIDFEDDAPSDEGFLKRYFVELPQLVLLVIRSILNFSRMKSLVKKFNARFDTDYRKWAGMDYNKMAPHEIMDAYRKMEKTFLWNWKTPIINDFYVMVFYGLLKKICAKWCEDRTGSLQNDLICGEGGIESTEPAKLLMKMAELVDNNPEYKELFQQNAPENISMIVSENDLYQELSKYVRLYLDKYGFRCMHELKLEEPSLHEDPSFIFVMIRNYLNIDDKSTVNPDVIAEKESEIRKKAESEAFRMIGKRDLLHIKKRLFLWVLNSARFGVKSRENMRFARTKIYGILRILLLAVGKRLADENILNDRNDIFMLTIDEVWDFIKGTAVTTDLKGLAALRRKEYEAYGRDDAPEISDHFETYGIAYHKNRFQEHRDESQESPNGMLKGIGCSPGIVTKGVRVLKSPQGNLSMNGEILVAARTDPGWVPLYPTVSGILIERGSILSHSAIVAREMGIPTIVGIPGLLKTVSNGQVVRMDGSSGTVDLIDEKNLENEGIAPG